MPLQTPYDVINVKQMWKIVILTISENFMLISYVEVEKIALDKLGLNESPNLNWNLFKTE